MKLLVSLLLLTATAFAQQESYDQLLKHWDYDRGAPLAIEEKGVEDRAGIKVHDISYAVPTDGRASSLGPNGGRVTAYLVVPPGKGPFPAVIYGHWCMPGSEKMNRNEFLAEAVVLARSGVISLLPDHVITRPGFVQNKDPLSAQQPEVEVQQVVNMRRGVDLLAARKDVDAKRLAFVGHSCDAGTAALLSGIERRFKAIVIMAGGLSDEVLLKTPMMTDFRQKTGAEKFDAYAAKYAWTDTAKYLSHSQGTPKLLQYATDEPYLHPDWAKENLKYVSDPKEFKLYTAPHALNADATRDRLQFLATRLGVKAPDAKLAATIPALTQPPWPKE